MNIYVVYVCVCLCLVCANFPSILFPLLLPLPSSRSHITSPQNLCTTSAPIQEGLHAVSCACAPLPFTGAWDADVTHIPPPPPTEGECFETSCQNETSGDLYAQSLICYGTVTTLYTYTAIVTAQLSESCVSLSVSASSGHVYTRPADVPLALSFLPTNYDLAGSNTYAVVSNGKGVTVGQILSAMIHFNVETFTSDGTFAMGTTLCVLLDPTMGDKEWGVARGCDVFDLGLLSADGVTIHPLGKESTENSTEIGNMMICFAELTLTSANTSLILIQRAANYESANTYTNGEADIVLTSGALFCFGGLVVAVFHCVTTLNLPILAIGVQSVCLLLFRGVYFFVLGSGDLPIGGLLDFALIEIPTFLYIGIFFQLIFPCYRFFFNQKLPKRALVASISISLLVNWLVFAALMIIISSTNQSSMESRSCDCQISDSVQQSNTAEIVRIVYKSIVLAVAVGVVTVTLIFRTQAEKAGGIQSIYYQIVFLSLGLLFDCVAFVVYYAVDRPCAYFLIVLWFTELLPVCTMNVVLTWKTRKIDLKFF